MGKDGERSGREKVGEERGREGKERGEDMKLRMKENEAICTRSKCGGHEESHVQWLQTLSSGKGQEEKGIKREMQSEGGRV